MDIEQANQQAVQRIQEAQPHLKGVAPARDVIPGMDERTLLHAGPPITWEEMTGPVQGAVIGALLYEGLADDRQEAEKLAASSDIRFAPCHEHATVGPMSGITSASMPVYIVENRDHGNTAYSNMNEGYGKVLRYGAFDDEVLDRLYWLRDEAAPVMDEALKLGGGLDLKKLLAESIQMGDEGHNRNKAGSANLARHLAPALAAGGAEHEALERIFTYLADNDLAMLNPVMAACKATTDAAHGIEGSTVVTAMTRNGTEFGLRVSGLGDRWFAAPAEVPDGLYFPGYDADDANPDFGDSTITETAGIGAFAMAAAPAIVSFIGGSPDDAKNATLEMYEITLAESSTYQIPALNFRGTPTGIDIRKVVETGILPRINTGIGHKEPGVGQIGAGYVSPPAACFEEAVRAMAKELAS